MKKIILVGLVVTGTLFAGSAEELMKQNGCFACHAVASKKSAPAFAGIGMRNKRFEGANAKEVIMQSIKNGSKGKYPMFSDTAMPAFSNFTQEELGTLADYILSQAPKAKGHRGHGRCGGKKGMGRRGMMQ